jgi:hypothetical protein
VDDVVVKNRNSDMLIADLEETFASLWEYQWKINPNKCVFGVPSGKLLGFIISHRSIEANHEKICAITNMNAPTCIKDVQKLTRCMAALNRFISKLEKWGLPFFKLLKHKRSSCGPQRLIKPWRSSKTSCPSHQSSRILAKRSSYYSTLLRLLTWSVPPSLLSGKKTATPIQSSDVSEVLSESKALYQPVQKLLYAVLITSRKFRHYFQEYSITVVTDYPLGDILRNQDATGRISKWAVELGALKIDFKPCPAIKSQALVDFMAEWWENQLPTPTERPENLVMYFDGSLKLEGANAGVLLISLKGEQLKYVLQVFSKVSNNEAEYEALLHGLRLAISLGIK